MSKIYILLPVHNRLEITRRFVHCLESQVYKNYHLLLIDDGSVDGTSQMVSGIVRTLTVINGTGNLWWAGSLQRGIDWLKRKPADPNDVILMINDDVQFDLAARMFSQ